VLLKTLKTLRVPGPLVDMIGFTLRYLSVLGEEIQAMIVAQKSRGLNTGSFASIRSYKRSGQLLGVLLIRSMERSVRIHQAMLSRGYDTSSGSRKRGKADVRHRSERPVVPVPGYDRSAEKRFV
jgi:cobalt/nickel transport system permease protein